MGFPFDVNGEAKDTPRVSKHVPEGDYEFIVHERPIHSVASTGKNMLTMKMVVDDGEHSGKSIRFNLVFLPKDHEHHAMTVKSLRAFGLILNGPSEIDEEDFMDKVVRAHVRVKNEKFIPKGETEAITVPKSEIGWFLDEGEPMKTTYKLAPKAAAVVRDEDEVPF